MKLDIYLDVKLQWSSIMFLTMCLMYYDSKQRTNRKVLLQPSFKTLQMSWNANCPSTLSGSLTWSSCFLLLSSMILIVIARAASSALFFFLQNGHTFSTSLSSRDNCCSRSSQDNFFLFLTCMRKRRSYVSNLYRENGKLWEQNCNKTRP